MIKAVKLQSPIKAHGNEVHVIELKEPTVLTIKKLGFPFDQSMMASPKKIADYVVELADLPPSSVDQLTPHDFLVLTQEVILFFSPKEVPNQPDTDSPSP